MTICMPPRSRDRSPHVIPPLTQTALGPSEAPQRPERNARASTVSNQTGETDAVFQGTTYPIFALVLLTWGGFPLAAQNVKDEFWPEVEIYVNQGSKARVVFVDSFNQDQNTRDQQGAFTYYIDFALKPIFRRELRQYEDVFRRRFLTFRAGYQYTTSFVNNDSSSENRIIVESTARYPLPANIVFTDRNRGEFRFIRGQPFSMRYRTRPWVERDFRVGRFVFTPYLYDEVAYDTRYGAWNRNRYAIGLQIPAGPHLVLEPYLLRQHDTRATPKYVNAIGFTFNLYF